MACDAFRSRREDLRHGEQGLEQNGGVCNRFVQACTELSKGTTPLNEVCRRSIFVRAYALTAADAASAASNVTIA